jgi:hypothetical protein
LFIIAGVLFRSLTEEVRSYVSTFGRISMGFRTPGSVP